MPDYIEIYEREDVKPVFDELRDENKKLREALGSERRMKQSLVDKYQNVKEKNYQLRSALKEISVKRRTVGGYVPVKSSWTMCQIAEEALKQ